MILAERDGIILRQSDEIPADLVDTGVINENREEVSRERAYICRFCGHTIALPADSMAIDGNIRHTFANPAGIVYEVVCFSAARGCRVVGTPTEEFTWFPGFSWRYALCAACASHMGWYYWNGSRGFFGLVASHITENW